MQMCYITYVTKYQRVFSCPHPVKVAAVEVHMSESDDSSVITFWTVVSSNRIHCKKLNFCCTLALRVYSVHSV